MAEGFDTKSASIEELSERELKWGYWYITHKEQLARAFRIFLVVLSVIFYSYSLVRLTMIYAFQYDELERSFSTAGADYINISGVHQSNAILEVQVISRDVLPLGGGKVDVVARVRNPNSKWALESFEYRFALGARVYEAQQAFLLPGEEKFLMSLNVDGASAGTPQIFIDNPQWKRVIGYEEWSPSRLRLTVVNKQFTPARQGELSGQLPLSEASAGIRNDSAYNFADVLVQFGLYSGNRLVGASQITLQDLRSGENRPVSARWSNVLPPVTRTDIIPSVLILDEKAYKDFEGDLELPFFER